VLSLDIFFTFLVVVVPSSASVRKLFAKIPFFAFDENDPIRSFKTVFVVAFAPTLILVLTLLLAIFVPVKMYC
jgi:hypothetical protein